MVAFSRLKKFEKRIQVAKDVMAQLRSEKLIAENGVPLKLGDPIAFSADTQVCDMTAKTTCVACALGSLFVTTVERMDRLRVFEAGYAHPYDYRTYTYETDKFRLDISWSQIEVYLSRIFSQSQLRLIEIAFEFGLGMYTASGDEELKALKFNKGFQSSRKRMERIMRNIIRNEGTFVP